jgi:hypothetical protein
MTRGNGRIGLNEPFRSHCCLKGIGEFFFLDLFPAPASLALHRREVRPAVATGGLLQGLDRRLYRRVYRRLDRRTEFAIDASGCTAEPKPRYGSHGDISLIEDVRLVAAIDLAHLDLAALGLGLGALLDLRQYLSDLRHELSRLLLRIGLKFLDRALEL